MTYPLKKHVVLPEKMDKLKKRINLSKEKQRSFTEIIHKTGKLSQYILGGIQKLIGLLSSIIKSAKELHIIGFALQMFSIIPNAITTLTDKNSSVINKTFSIIVLLTTSALGITAFILGGVVAAGIGLAFASLTTLVEGISFLGALINKYKTSKAYKEKIQFMNLLETFDTSLNNDKYRNKLEIRALELEHLGNLSTEEAKQLQFIRKIHSKVGLSELVPDNSPVMKLSKLYKERKELLASLANITEEIDESKEFEADTSLIEEVSNIQHQIDKIDKDIANITEPLFLLEENTHLADETIVKSYTNFVLGGTGVILSTIGLIILIGTATVPPLWSPILLGFSIGLALFGLIKWGVELQAKSVDEQILEERTKENEEIILEEALEHYDHELSDKFQGSYSIALRPILESPATAADTTNLQNEDVHDLPVVQEPKNPPTENKFQPIL
ncbi:hypothetical protein DGG96_11025 [Legionella qingyii]|uniref:SidA protein, subsrate of the Dot/Icm transport system n=2 Tax=Legionella qingyii TaxID=2184757 RepID=A0A317U5H9_9GAMM|nr:T4SS effector SidA family protein [Legionella qingyii]PWY55630.1 hypothetical protein DGG96_11025 [Legionella qingyii]RUR21775.1 hypothetical protein ELY20_11145 [Legionella qingyii]RUR25297.1 hypothetical protein ELY16_10205 [Legionella qingyii]